MGKPQGKIVIVSSPSGGGKTSICRKLLSPKRKEQGWRFSVSYTTRKPRKGEKDGREYFFVDETEFNRLKKEGFFAETARVHEWQYGTPRGPIDDVLKHGGVMLFDVDVQGARSLHREYPDAIAIFILPPSKKALEERLRQRGTETAAELQVRFETAKREMREFRKYKFDYVVVNKELGDAVQKVLAIVMAHGCRIENIPTEQIESITG